jgi:hypothetical protein
MSFGYCFGCGTRVSTADLAAGAKRLRQGLCCKACLKEFEEAHALAGTPNAEIEEAEGD